MAATRDPRPEDADYEYSYRRPLTLRELLPAIGAGVGAGIAVGAATFYVARLFLQRTPLRPERTPRVISPAGSRSLSRRSQG